MKSRDNASSATRRYRLKCQAAAARCVEVQRNYFEVLSAVVIFHQAAPSLPRKLPAVTRMECEKEATQGQALLFSSGGTASSRHTDTVLHAHPYVSASQEHGASAARRERPGPALMSAPAALSRAASLAPCSWHEPAFLHPDRASSSQGCLMSLRLSCVD
jgi:hypothetical protein